MEARGQRGVRAAGQACCRMAARGPSAVPGTSGGKAMSHTLHNCSGHRRPVEAIPETGAHRGETLQNSGPETKDRNRSSSIKTRKEKKTFLRWL